VKEWFTVLNQIFSAFFEIFTIKDDATRYILVAFLVLCILSLILRLILAFGYQAQAALFHLYAKPVKAKEDLGKLKGSLLPKVVKDYISMADKNICVNNVKAIAEKHMMRLNLFGWAYKSMERFILSYERGLPFIGILLAVIFSDYRYAFGIVTAAAFIVLKLGEGLFDFQLTAEKLSLDITEYVTQEAGQFYGNDTASIVLRLKAELTAAITAQARSLDKSMEKLADNIGGALNLSIKELAEKLDLSIDQMEKPLSNWKKALEECESVQKNIQAILKETEKLTTIRVTNKELQYIETNRQQLETSMRLFEANMEELTKKLGTALGSIIEYHVQSSYNVLNSELKENIGQMAKINQDLIMRVQRSFSNFMEQSRDQSQSILKALEAMQDSNNH